jgi:hypothetical protein
VVLARNIGKYSLVLRQPGEGLSLQTSRMTDDDLDAFDWQREAAKVSSARAELILCPKVSARRRKCEGNDL